MKKVKVNIGILNFAASYVGNALLSNLVDLMRPLSNDLYLITEKTGHHLFKENEKIHTYEFKHKKGTNVFTRILNFFFTQLRISYTLAKITRKRNIDLWIFYIGGVILVLPMLTVKLLKKRGMVILTGNTGQTIKLESIMFFKVIRILAKTNFIMSDQIVMEIKSESLLNQAGLSKYRDKVSFGSFYVDINLFKIKNELKDRKNIIGYVGRLAPEKGVMNFVKAIPLILKERNDLEFIIGSGGPLFEKIKDELKKNGSSDEVTLTGWVPREKLPDYFNEMKLIVVPSYTESIPIVALEAMACGTPVVAAPAGAIPDLIKDGENGFLMENNSPACIAKNVIRALDDSRLDEIVKSAHELINREYTYEAVVENYRKLLMKKG